MDAGPDAVAVDGERRLALRAEGHERHRRLEVGDLLKPPQVDALAGQALLQPLAPGIVADAPGERSRGAVADRRNGDVGEGAAEVRAEGAGLTEAGRLLLADQVNDRLTQAEDRAGGLAHRLGA